MLLINTEIDIEYQKKYNQTIMYMVFILNFTCSILCNIDHGSIPGFAEDIKRQFG